MSKRLFGDNYYSMENSYVTKAEAERDANKLRKSGKYFVRVAQTGWGTKKIMGRTPHKWAVYLRIK